MPPITHPPKTIGIVGSRRRTSDEDYVALLTAFDRVYRKGDRIVSGGCPRGADYWAEVIARQRGITITIHYADWEGALGKGAGFHRNTFIAEDADVLIALVAEDRTGGTEDTVTKSLLRHREVILT